jgi:hypothetical protein
VGNYYDEIRAAKYCLSPYGHGWGIREPRLLAGGADLPPAGLLAACCACCTCRPAGAGLGVRGGVAARAAAPCVQLRRVQCAVCSVRPPCPPCPPCPAHARAGTNIYMAYGCVPVVIQDHVYQVGGAAPGGLCSAGLGVAGPGAPCGAGCAARRGCAAPGGCARVHCCLPQPAYLHACLCPKHLPRLPAPRPPARHLPASCLHPDHLPRLPLPLQPYEDVLPYQEFSVRLAATDIPRIGDILRAITEVGQGLGCEGMGWGVGGL